MKNAIVLAALLLAVMVPGAFVSAAQLPEVDALRAAIQKQVDLKKQEAYDKVCAKLLPLKQRFPQINLPPYCASGPVQEAPSVTLTALPLTVQVGASSLLTWTSSDADSCVASGGWNGAKALSGSQSVTVPATTTYTLACANEAGTTTRSVTVNATPVPPAPTPTVTLNASPLTVQVGSTSTLAWSSTNSTSCVASNGWTGTKALSGNQVVTVSATTTYTLACGHGTATSTQSVTVNATPVPAVPAPTTTLSAASLAVQTGATTTLTWSSTNAIACTASNGWTGAKALSGTEIVTISATTTYTLGCGNGTATSTQSVTVNAIPVPVLPAPTTTLTALPLTVQAGATTTLTWSSTNASACVASNGWIGSKALSGNEIVTVSATTTYTLACGNGTATSTQSVTVNTTPIPPATPSLTLTALPLTVEAGATTTLTWVSVNAGICEASNGWTGTKAVFGSEVVTVNATTTYTLACGNGTATSTESVTVNTTPAPVPPTLSFTGVPLQILAGATSTLTWSSANATSCTASNGWTGAKALSGNEVVGPLATTTYALACSGAGGATSTSVTIGVTPTTTAVLIGHVVISEVYYDVDATHGSEPANEWVELFNASANPVDLNGWKLQDESGLFDTIATSSLVIAPNAFLLITNSTTTPSFWANFTPVVFLNSPIGNALGNTQDSVVLMNAASTTIDAVSWGTATTTSVMVPTVPDVATGHSIGRIQFTADTNTNADWGNFASPTPAQ